MISPVSIPPDKSLVLNRVTKRYGSVHAVDQVSLMTEYGEFLAILYVTHNLPEAFSLADTMAIMQGGKIVQIDAPSRVRSRPANQFVGDFIRSFEL